MTTKTTADTKDASSNNNGRVISSFCHIIGFVSGLFIPFSGIVSAPIVWAFGAFISNVDEKDVDLLNNHGKEALNFRLSLLIYCAIILFAAFGISIVAAIIGTQLTADPMAGLAFGFSGGAMGGMALSMIFTVVIVIFDFICVLRAAVHAFQGKQTRYPLTIHFIK